MLGVAKAETALAVPPVAAEIPAWMVESVPQENVIDKAKEDYTEAAADRHAKYREVLGYAWGAGASETMGGGMNHIPYYPANQAMKGYMGGEWNVGLSEGLYKEISSMKLTNPEAGPSDTVPAMLTPGEAVIPASVAMDEDYKPLIKEMVEEGRDRNDAAEAIGIPVNHPAVPGLADGGALDSKISKIYNEGYTAPGQAYAIAKSKGYAGGRPAVNPETYGKAGEVPEWVLDFIPVVGEAKGAKQAYDAYKAGDYGDAALEAGGTLLGAVPGGDLIKGLAVLGGAGYLGAKGLKKFNKAMNADYNPKHIWGDYAGWADDVSKKFDEAADAAGDYYDPEYARLVQEGRIPTPNIYQKAPSKGGKGFEEGTTMIPKPMGAPPKYNIEEPGYKHFDQAEMGQGTSMEMTNAKHKQQVANKEGAQAQKMDHMMQTDMYKLQMDAMKADQKMAQKMAEKSMDMDAKMMEADVDSEVARRKQEALTTSMGGYGLTVPPVEMPPTTPFGDEFGQALDAAGTAEDLQGFSPVHGYADGEPKIKDYLDNPVGALFDKWRFKREKRQKEKDAYQRLLDEVNDPNYNPFVHGYADGVPLTQIYGGLFDNATPPPVATPTGTAMPGEDVIEIPREDIPDATPAPEVPGMGIPETTDDLLRAVGMSDALDKPIGYWEDKQRMEQNEAVQQAAAMKKAEEAEAAGQEAIEYNKAKAAEAAEIANDPTADPARRARAAREVEQREKANMDNERQVQMAAASKLGAGESMVEDQARLDPNGNPIVEWSEEEKQDLDNWAKGTGSYEAAAQAEAASGEEKRGWLSAVGDVFKGVVGNLTDPNSLATAAIVYGANRLLGYDHNTAGSEALKFHNAGVQKRHATVAAAQKRAQDLQDYQRKKVIDEAVKAPGEAAKAQREFVGKSREFNTKLAEDALGTKGLAYNQETGQRLVDATPEKLAAEHTQFLKDYGITDFESGAAVETFETAIRRASEAGVDGKRARSIKPFLESAFMERETNLGQGSFSIPQEDGSFKPMSSSAMNSLNRLIGANQIQQGNAGTRARGKRLQALGAMWQQLPQTDPKLYEQYVNKAKARKDVTAFFLFAEDKAKQVQANLNKKAAK